MSATRFRSNNNNNNNSNPSQSQLLLSRANINAIARITRSTNEILSKNQRRNRDIVNTLSTYSNPQSISPRLKLPNRSPSQQETTNATLSSIPTTQQPQLLSGGTFSAASTTDYYHFYSKPPATTTLTSKERQIHSKQSSHNHQSNNSSFSFGGEQCSSNNTFLEDNYFSINNYLNQQTLSRDFQYQNSNDRQIQIKPDTTERYSPIQSTQSYTQNSILITADRKGIDAQNASGGTTNSQRTTKKKCVSFSPVLSIASPAIDNETITTYNLNKPTSKFCPANAIAAESSQIQQIPLLALENTKESQNQQQEQFVTDVSVPQQQTAFIDFLQAKLPGAQLQKRSNSSIISGSSTLISAATASATTRVQVVQEIEPIQQQQQGQQKKCMIDLASLLNIKKSANCDSARKSNNRSNSNHLSSNGLYSNNDYCRNSNRTCDSKQTYYQERNNYVADLYQGPQQQENMYFTNSKELQKRSDLQGISAAAAAAAAAAVSAIVGTEQYSGVSKGFVSADSTPSFMHNTMNSLVNSMKNIIPIELKYPESDYFEKKSNNIFDRDGNVCQNQDSQYTLFESSSLLEQPVVVFNLNKPEVEVAYVEKQIEEIEAEEENDEGQLSEKRKRAMKQHFTATTSVPGIDQLPLSSPFVYNWNSKDIASATLPPTSIPLISVGLSSKEDDDELTETALTNTTTTLTNTNANIISTNTINSNNATALSWANFSNHSFNLSSAHTPKQQKQQEAGSQQLQSHGDIPMISSNTSSCNTSNISLQENRTAPSSFSNMSSLEIIPIRSHHNRSLANSNGSIQLAGLSNKQFSKLIQQSSNNSNNTNVSKDKSQVQSERVHQKEGSVTTTTTITTTTINNIPVSSSRSSQLSSAVGTAHDGRSASNTPTPSPMPIIEQENVSIMSQFSGIQIKNMIPHQSRVQRHYRHHSSNNLQSANSSQSTSYSNIGGQQVARLSASPSPLPITSLPFQLQVSSFGGNHTKNRSPAPGLITQGVSSRQTTQRQQTEGVSSQNNKNKYLVNQDSKIPLNSFRKPEFSPLRFVDTKKPRAEATGETTDTIVSGSIASTNEQLHINLRNQSKSQYSQSKEGNNSCRTPTKSYHKKNASTPNNIANNNINKNQSSNEQSKLLPIDSPFCYSSQPIQSFSSHFK